jgi:hypothetical protein
MDGDKKDEMNFFNPVSTRREQGHTRLLMGTGSGTR